LRLATLAALCDNGGNDKERRMRGRGVAAGIAIGLLAMTGAFAQRPAPSGPALDSRPSLANEPAAPSSPAADAAKVAFEALPEEARRAIQEALVWTGDFNGTVSGGFGKRTYDAIVAFQKKSRLRADGILDPAGRTALESAAKRARDAARFALVTDDRTGARIGVPEAIFVKREAVPNGGTRWQSADGKITLDTRLVPASEGDLAALYERLLNVQTPGRKVTYKFYRPEFFVITGETPTGRFYLRYAAVPAGVRGFTLGYDKSLGTSFDRMVIAIANSYVPDPTTAVAATSPAAPPPRPVEPARPAAPAGTGLIVGPRLVVSALATCAEPRAGGVRGRVVARDDRSGLTLIETETSRSAKAPGLRGLPLGPGEPVVVVAFTGPEPILVATTGSAGGLRSLFAPLQPGAGGAIVLDRSGALVGLVAPLSQAPRRVAGIVPPMSHAAVSAEDLTAFLSSRDVTLPTTPTEPPRSVGAVVAPIASALVPVECGPAPARRS
jgi:peptidoglycan hydrolase-like protein with peptidoglycan-binding domain